MEPPYDTGLTCGQLVLQEWVDEIGLGKMNEYIRLIQAVLAEPLLWREIIDDIPDEALSAQQAHADQSTMMLHEAWSNLKKLCPGGRDCRHG